MKLLILAGGFGTRLKSAIAGVPKPLAPVGNLPFLQLQIEHWRAQGLRKFTFLLHHQAHRIVDFIESISEGPLKDCEVDWLIEYLPMDTGGAIAYAVKELRLTGNFLVANADTWLGSGIYEMTQSVAPAIAVVNLQDISRYGQLHFDRYKFITHFAEKKSQIEAGWISAGLYHLSADLFANWDGQPFSLERKLFETLVQYRTLVAVPLKSEFIDIGIPTDYYRFCRWIEEGRKTPLCN